MRFFIFQFNSAICNLIIRVIKSNTQCSWYTINNTFTPKLKHVFKLFCLLTWVKNYFLHKNCLKWSLSYSNLAHWKYKLEMTWILWEIQLFISVSDFHSFKPNVIEHVLLVWMGQKCCLRKHKMDIQVKSYVSTLSFSSPINSMLYP